MCDICVSFLVAVLIFTAMKVRAAKCEGKSDSIMNTCGESGEREISQEATELNQELLQLPPAGTDGEAESGGKRTLDLGTGAKDLTDELGPLVINKDGTTARITNWHKMMPDEKKRTLRIITKRNRERLAVLKQEL